MKRGLYRWNSAYCDVSVTQWCGHHVNSVNNHFDRLGYYWLQVKADSAHSSSIIQTARLTSWCQLSGQDYLPGGFEKNCVSTKLRTGSLNLTRRYQQVWSNCGLEHQQVWSNCGLEHQQVWSNCGLEHQQVWSNCGLEHQQVWSKCGLEHQQVWSKCGLERKLSIVSALWNEFLLVWILNKNIKVYC